MALGDSTTPRLHRVPLRRVLLWSMLAAGFAAVVVQYSFHAGQLLLGPWGDTAGYFDAGLSEVDRLYDRGLLAALAANAADPPRSPFASLVASASFLLLGRHDWAPFAGNAVLVLAMLVLVDAVLGPVRRAPRVAAAVLVLATPMLAHAVAGFVPDYAWGISLAAACVATQLLRPGASSRRAAVLVGVLWAAVLLVKPNVVPVTLMMMLGSLAAVALSDLFLERPRAAGRSVFARLGVTLLTAAALAGPYYAVRARSSPATSPPTSSANGPRSGSTTAPSPSKLSSTSPAPVAASRSGRR